MVTNSTFLHKPVDPWILSTKKIPLDKKCKSWSSIFNSKEEEKSYESTKEPGLRKSVLIKKSKLQDNVSTDKTSGEVDDMSSLLEFNTLALSKNHDDQNKDEKNNHVENKANISTETQDDPADVLVKNPKGTESLYSYKYSGGIVVSSIYVPKDNLHFKGSGFQDSKLNDNNYIDLSKTLIFERSTGEIMNHSNNDHNDEFQDKLKPRLHVPKDFNLHKVSNFDKSVYKVPHFQV